MALRKLKIPYDPQTREPAVRASICTGELTVGFLDKQTGKFHDLKLVRSRKELEEFRQATGVTELKKIY